MDQNEPDIRVSLPAINFADSPPPTFAVQATEVGPDNPPWGLGGAAGTWLGSVLFLFAIQSAMVLGYAFYRHVDMFALQDFVLHDPNAIFVTALSLLPTHLLTLGLVWLVVTRGGKYSFLRTIGWEWAPGFNFWTCTALAVVLLIVGIAITASMGDKPTALDDMIQRSAAARYVIAILATFTAPLTEEFVYRGVLYPALQRLTGRIWAVAGVLALFTLVHVPQYWPSYGVILTIGLLSFFLTAIRAYTGRILPCVVIHTVFNGIQSIWIVFGPFLNDFIQRHMHGAKPVPAPQGMVLMALSVISHLKI
jgi:membrane protease YdiL (CAAX protease family)